MPKKMPKNKKTAATASSLSSVDVFPAAMADPRLDFLFITRQKSGVFMRLNNIQIDTEFKLKDHKDRKLDATHVVLQTCFTPPAARIVSL